LIACNDAWAPCDCHDGAAGHALCNAHVLRELVAVTETGTDADVTWARQAIDALLALKAAGAARAEGLSGAGTEALEEHAGWFRDAAAAGALLNAGDRPARRAVPRARRQPRCRGSRLDPAGRPADQHRRVP
jgi:transposase